MPGLLVIKRKKAERKNDSTYFNWSEKKPKQQL